MGVAYTYGDSGQSKVATMMGIGQIHCSANGIR